MGNWLTVLRCICSVRSKGMHILYHLYFHRPDTLTVVLRSTWIVSLNEGHLRCKGVHVKRMSRYTNGRVRMCRYPETLFYEF